MRGASERDRTGEALVAACSAGDPRAWSEFADRYTGFARGVALRVLRRAGVCDPQAHADDVVSDVFAELLAEDCKALRRFRAPFSLEAWLSVITRRRAGRHVQQLRRAPLALERPARVESGRRAVVTDVALGEQRAQVRERLADLSARDRLALQLFYEGGQSYKEVASQLELPVNRVGTLLARARSRLLRALCA